MSDSRIFCLYQCQGLGHRVSAGSPCWDYEHIHSVLSVILDFIYASSPKRIPVDDAVAFYVGRTSVPACGLMVILVPKLKIILELEPTCCDSSSLLLWHFLAFGRPDETANIRRSGPHTHCHRRQAQAYGSDQLSRAEIIP